MPQVATKEQMEPRPAKPWWREPWPWILMAGPAAAMIGCIITIFLAVQNFSDQAITDGGIKRGLVVSKPAVATNPTQASPEH
ncbi:FixH family protein [Pollutimonas subterranea]|uniref:FixH family protein n=1 Tax=Pollutimonas subterranea TaxID=2045210 RepID=UPI0026916C98